MTTKAISFVRTKRPRGASSGRAARPHAKTTPPAMDGRLPGLLLDTLGVAAAAIASATTGVGYGELFSEMAFSAQERERLSAAAAAVASAHAAFFSLHRGAIELAATLAALESAHIHAALSAADIRAAESGQPAVGLSGPAALAAAAVILAPLLILIVVLIKQSRPKGTLHAK
ncbi:MAG: hypothetical protein ACRD1C_01930 [Terriglobales bacterium]